MMNAWDVATESAESDPVVLAAIVIRPRATTSALST